MRHEHETGGFTDSTDLMVCDGRARPGRLGRALRWAGLAAVTQVVAILAIVMVYQVYSVHFGRLDPRIDGLLDQARGMAAPAPAGWVTWVEPCAAVEPADELTPEPLAEAEDTRYNP